MATRGNHIFRIAITGPESTGKSTLAQQLAKHYNTIWVPEYARTYIDNLDRDYIESDLLKIAAGQLASEERMIENAKRLIFCDTELTVVKIWAESKYARVHPWILSKYHEISYDFYLLNNVDLHWKFDPQRENPQKGKYFFDRFERELQEKNALFEVVSGDEHIRLQNAIRIIDNRLKSHSFQL